MSTTDPDFTARETLRLIGPAPDNWVPRQPGIDHNVAIIGGGQSGTTFAFALRRAGIGEVTVLDRASEETEAGVWLSRARMHKLRTPKNLVGPDLGLPGLSFQAWYESRHGASAYAAIDRIARTDWAAYLNWFRSTVDVPVRFGTRLKRVEPAADHLRLHLSGPAGETVETARKLILANGVDGSGAPNIPVLLRDNLPADLYAHTSDPVDFAALRGKSVAVLGSAASAFDAAAVALEAGAADVHLFARRTALASSPVMRVRGYPGAYDNYYALPDAAKWQQARRFRQAGSTPPPDSISRVTRFANFHLHLGASWRDVRHQGGKAIVATASERLGFDFVIAGTGYVTDVAARDELRDVAGDILLWRDRFLPPPDQRDEALGAYPYLGAGHEYLEKQPGRAPYLKNIHVFNPGAFVSFGLPVGDVPSFRRDIPGVVARISHDLFFADLAVHEARINGPIADDFSPDLYADAVWRPAVAHVASA